LTLPNQFPQKRHLFFCYLPLSSLTHHHISSSTSRFLARVTRIDLNGDFITVNWNFFQNPMLPPFSVYLMQKSAVFS
jgi:hypothetical protein